MPVDFDIDVPNGRLIVNVSGQVSAAQVLDAQAGVMTHPDYRPDLDVLIDARLLTSLAHLSSTELRKLTATSLADPKARQVIVLPASSAPHYGLARMYQLERTARCPEGPVVICETLRDALTFLKRN